MYTDRPSRIVDLTRLLLLSALLMAAFAPPAAAQTCAALGEAIVGHACFHATNGPFDTVAASAARVFAATSPNINAVHTHFTINLPGSPGANEGTVKYRPARTGDWAFFHNPNVPVLVLDPAGAVVPLKSQHEVSGCPQLPRAVVVDLTAGITYRLVLGPAAVGSVGVVAEKLSDFETSYFRDADGDAFGDPGNLVTTVCTPPAGHVSDDTDCDDGRAAVHPGAPELCNGRDDDCDGTVDEGFPTPCTPAVVPALGGRWPGLLAAILGLLGVLLSRRGSRRTAGDVRIAIGLRAR